MAETRASGPIRGTGQASDPPAILTCKRPRRPLDRARCQPPAAGAECDVPPPRLRAGHGRGSLLRGCGLFGGSRFGFGLRSLFLGICEEGLNHAVPLVLSLGSLGFLSLTPLARVPSSRVAHGILHLGA